jgi:threonine aldolase
MPTAGTPLLRGYLSDNAAGAPEFFTNGARMVLVDGPGSKIDPNRLKAAVARRTEP